LDNDQTMNAFPNDFSLIYHSFVQFYEVTVEFYLDFLQSA